MAIPVAGIRARFYQKDTFSWAVEVSQHADPLEMDFLQKLVDTDKITSDTLLRFMLLASLKATFPFADSFADFAVSRPNPISERPKPRLAGRPVVRLCVDPQIFKATVDFEEFGRCSNINGINGELKLLIYCLV